MPDYRVLGGYLRSALEFPNLPEISSTRPSWELEITDDPPPKLTGEVLGSDPVRGEFSVSNLRTGSGYRLSYDDTGVYDILDGGDRIVWHRPPVTAGPWSPEQFGEAVRIDILGRVLALAMHAQGILALHGSAVELGGKAIAFLAPKLHGKSTLASALIGAGARLITDDTLPIELGAPAVARPGVHSLRMWEDSTRQVGSGNTRFVMGTFGKLQSHDLPEESLVNEPTPLDTVYFLAPIQRGAALPAVQIEEVDPRAAALALVRHARLGPLLGRSEAAVLLDRAADLSRSAKIRTLGLVRDFGRLNEAVTCLLDLHRG